MRAERGGCGQRMGRKYKRGEKIGRKERGDMEKKRGERKKEQRNRVDGWEVNIRGMMGEKKHHREFHLHKTQSAIFTLQQRWEVQLCKYFVTVL